MKRRDLSAKRGRAWERSDLLADPLVYADKQRSNELIVEFKDAAAKLTATSEEWERAQAELDAIESANGDLE